MKTLREQLKRDLRANRYTFTHLANEAGITISGLSRIVNGNRNAKPTTAEAIAEAATKLTGIEYNADQFKKE